MSASAPWDLSQSLPQAELRRKGKPPAFCLRTQLPEAWERARAPRRAPGREAPQRLAETASLTWQTSLGPGSSRPHTCGNATRESRGDNHEWHVSAAGQRTSKPLGRYRGGRQTRLPCSLLSARTLACLTFQPACGAGQEQAQAAGQLGGARELARRRLARPGAAVTSASMTVGATMTGSNKPLASTGRSCLGSHSGACPRAYGSIWAPLLPAGGLPAGGSAPQVQGAPL